MPKTSSIRSTVSIEHRLDGHTAIAIVPALARVAPVKTGEKWLNKVFAEGIIIIISIIIIIIYSFTYKLSNATRTKLTYYHT